MGGGGGSGRGGGGQGGFERRIEVFVKIQKKKIIIRGVGGRVRWGSGWWGVRVEVNDELKFLGKFKKKIKGGRGGRRIGGGGGGGVRNVVRSGYM